MLYFGFKYREMNRYLLIILLISVCLACKEKKAEDPVKEEEIANDADFGELYQFFHANPTTRAQEEENKMIEYMADKNMEASRTRSGVYIANHRVGSGDSIQWADPIEVHYKGYFMDGQEFDSSIKRDEPIRFRVGSMVAGWNEALPYLRVGSKASFIIPSHMGYGEEGFEGFVGPNRILVFDIEILRKTDKNK